jgi:GNAT superfamily N-acetyltransferase
VPTVQVGPLVPGHVEEIPRAFAAANWPGKGAGLYRRYLTEQDDGTRAVLVASADAQFLGYVTVMWGSGYLPFREAGIPEISDLNVLPQFRRQHVGTALMDAAESAIATRGTTAGLGVGLYADHVAAHLMYLKRGYLPDGHGVAYEFTPLLPGATVRVDDNLNLMMTRVLAPDPLRKAAYVLASHG